MAGRGKCRLVLRAIERVGQEQAAEEHDLGRQEQPHSQFIGFVLLFKVVELVGSRRARMRNVFRHGFVPRRSTRHSCSTCTLGRLQGIQLAIVVRFFEHDGRRSEILRGGRRWSLPFQPGRAPGFGPAILPYRSDHSR